MKQKHIYLFFISILITGYSFSQQEKQITARDTLPPGEKYGLRVGVDLSRIIRSSVDEKYDGFEIVGDYRISHNFFVAAEVGKESLIRDEENINAEGSGNYIRVGLDYNSYDNWYGMQNSIYVGLRYGFSSFEQSLNDYAIFTGTTYFGENRITTPISEKSLNASWLELVVGIKAELFANLYLSANVSLRSIVNEKQPDRFENLYIPGFGRTNDFSSIGVGYGYTLSYLIPFYKKKK